MMALDLELQIFVNALRTLHEPLRCRTAPSDCFKRIA